MNYTCIFKTCIYAESCYSAVKRGIQIVCSVLLISTEIAKNLNTAVFQVVWLMVLPHFPLCTRDTCWSKSTGITGHTTLEGALAALLVKAESSCADWVNYSLIFHEWDSFSVSSFHFGVSSLTRGRLYGEPFQGADICRMQVVPLAPDTVIPFPCSLNLTEDAWQKWWRPFHQAASPEQMRPTKRKKW